MSDSDPLTHFSYFITELNNRNLAYLHMLEGDMMTQQRQLDYVALRKLYSGQYIANNGYNCETGKQALADEAADLIAYGVPFLSNPDLVSRFKHNSELNQVDQNTFYGGDEHGYTDYPFMNESTVKSSTSSNNDVETA